MAKKLKGADGFAAELQKILEDYGDEIDKCMADAVKDVTKAGAKAVKEEARSKFGGTGEYAKGWTSKIENGRTGTEGIIYNKKPGLPHLLENGHAKRGGGRVAGRSHIKPVEEQVIKDFEGMVKSKI